MKFFLTVIISILLTTFFVKADYMESNTPCVQDKVTKVIEHHSTFESYKTPGELQMEEELAKIADYTTAGGGSPYYWQTNPKKLLQYLKEMEGRLKSNPQ